MPDRNALAKYMFESRMEIHGHYEDEKSWDEQDQMIKDWLLQEADAVLKFFATEAR